MSIRRIHNIDDVIASLNDVRNNVLDGKTSSTTSYASNSCVSRMMSVIHATIRYDRARQRGEVREIAFMHKPGVRKAKPSK